MIKKSITILALVFLGFEPNLPAQRQALSSDSKRISPDLFGIFFEDLSYAADGGLYAELIQNRSFEYNPGDRKEWNSLTAWEYIAEGFGYGTITLVTTLPVHVFLKRQHSNTWFL